MASGQDVMFVDGGLSQALEEVLPNAETAR